MGLFQDHRHRRISRLGGLMGAASRPWQGCDPEIPKESGVVVARDWPEIDLGLFPDAT